MIPIPVKDVLDWTGGRYFGSPALLFSSVSDVVIDSRAATEGCLFVPVRGGNFDGHTFIEDARNQGALLVLTETPLDSEPYILVPDALIALQSIAAAYRKLFPIPVVAITGSMGKTSTKEMIASVLAERFRVHKNQGNLNNQTGLPLTVFQLGRGHEVSVVELGTNHFGEIEPLARIVSPDVCVLTNIGVSHIEFFGSREGIFREKTAMLQHQKPGGTTIVNGDDDLLLAIPGAVRFGLDEGCDVRAADIRDLGLDGVAFTACCDGEKIALHVRAPGKHMVYNALSAIAVGLHFGMPLADLKRGVESFSAQHGRMHVRRTGKLTVIDDSYNSNPASVMSAIDVLEKARGRRVAVLGDMRELGQESDELHEICGMYAAMHGIDLIVCVGPSSEQTFVGALSLAPQRTRYFGTQESMLLILPELIEPGDTVLVKASRGMGLEETVEALMKY